MRLISAANNGGIHNSSPKIIISKTDVLKTIIAKAVMQANASYADNGDVSNDWADVFRYLAR